MVTESLSSTVHQSSPLSAEKNIQTSATNHFFGDQPGIIFMQFHVIEQNENKMEKVTLNIEKLMQQQTMNVLTPTNSICFCKTSWLLNQSPFSLSCCDFI